VQLLPERKSHVLQTHECWAGATLGKLWSKPNTTQCAVHYNDLQSVPRISSVHHNQQSDKPPPYYRIISFKAQTQYNTNLKFLINDETLIHKKIHTFHPRLSNPAAYAFHLHLNLTQPRFFFLKKKSNIIK
jgi:hypothetical protein